MAATGESTTLNRTIIVGGERIDVELTSHPEYTTRTTLRSDAGTAVFGVEDGAAEYLQEGTPDAWARAAMEQLGTAVV